jgi:hypothetical protein
MTQASPSATLSQADSVTPSQPAISLAVYAKVGALLSVFSGLLVYISRMADAPAPRSQAILGPVFALVALVACVWLIMVVVRNLATLRGLSSPQYYLTYNSDVPADWIERPARTFNNLMQIPTLFYLVCTLMLITQKLDRAQLAYAWLFVVVRVVHAVVYISWNPLPYRFATWIMGCITLWVLWTRFALQAWPGL